MTPTRQGSIRLFQFSGIEVFLHWSWFLIAVFMIQARAREYSSILWNILEYMALFGIVLLHEFGHALACRQVGGQADQIVLWPLGGVAYVAPPPRPGATLWSIAAGPLVNVALFPLFTAAMFLAGSWGWAVTMPNLHGFLEGIWLINLILLIFNLLPVYPLDGGQILQSLLWFVLGRPRSLMIASMVGILGVVGLVALALYQRSVWIGIMAVFILMNCWQGLQHARVLARLAKLPRRSGMRCPECGQPPLVGGYWQCEQCRQQFDLFETRGVCPFCQARFSATRCPECGKFNAVESWIVSPPAVPGSYVSREGPPATGRF